MKKLLSLLLSFTLLISPLSSVYATDPVDEDKFLKEGTQGSGKDFYYLQAESLGAAASGLNMFVCFSTGGWSHTIFAVGGASYIWGEVATAKQAKEYRDYRENRLKQLEQNTNNAGGSITQATADIQMVALNEKLTEENMTLELLKKRKDYADFAAIMYDLAAASAAVEVGIHYAPFMWWFGYTYCPTLPFVVPPIIATLIAAFGTYENFKNAQEATGETKLGINSVAFAAKLQSMSVATAIVFTGGVILPETRTALFIAQAILAEKVKDQLQDRIDKANENITKIKAMLSHFQNNTQPSGGITPGLAGSGNYSGNGAQGGVSAGGNYQVLPNVGTPHGTNVGCFSNSSNGVNLSQAGCSNPIKFEAKLPDFKNPELANFTQQALSYGNSLASGDTKSASLQAQAFSANAARIRAIRDEALSKASVEAKKNGYDLNAMIKDKENEINKAMSDSSLKAGLGGGANLASIGTSSSGASSNGSSNVANPSWAANLNGADKGLGNKGIKMPVIGTGTSGVSSVGDGSGMSDEEKDVIAANVDRNKSDFKANEGDSLFKVVSKTYIRNLDRILTRKKKNLDEETIKDAQ